MVESAYIKDSATEEKILKHISKEIPIIPKELVFTIGTSVWNKGKIISVKLYCYSVEAFDVEPSEPAEHEWNLRLKNSVDDFRILGNIIDIPVKTSYLRQGSLDQGWMEGKYSYYKGMDYYSDHLLITEENIHSSWCVLDSNRECPDNTGFYGPILEQGHYLVFFEPIITWSCMY